MKIKKKLYWKTVTVASNVVIIFPNLKKKLFKNIFFLNFKLSLFKKIILVREVMQCLRPCKRHINL